MKGQNKVLYGNLIMADITSTKIVSLERLGQYNDILVKKMEAYDQAVDAKSIKSIAVVGDEILYFKTVEVPMTEGENPVADASKAAYKVAISSSDVTTLKSEMAVVKAATAGYNADNTIATAIGAVDTKVDTLDNSLKAVAKSGKAEDVTVADEDGKITATTVEGALAELANAISGLDGDLATVAKSGKAEDVLIADASEKYTATTVEGAFLEVANNIDAINTKIGTVADDTTVMDEIGKIQTKLDTVEEGAQVNVIESITLNGVDVTVADKKAAVVIPTESKNLTARQIMKPDAPAEETDYHGSATDYATSAYVYNQLAGILPAVLNEIDGIFDVASNILYRTVETYADLQKVDMKDAESGIYIYLVKQDESQDPRVPADGDTPAEYFTTMYIYLTTDPEAGFQLIGKLNVSEQMLERITADAIKSALYDSVTDPESGAQTYVPKFYTRTEGAAVAGAVEAEVTRATGVESGLDTRLQAVEEAVGGEGSVAEMINDAIDALDATVSTVTVEETNPILNISVTETDGKLTAITASVKENTFDAYGDAATAETNAKAYADALYTVATEDDITALFEDEE